MPALSPANTLQNARHDGRAARGCATPEDQSHPDTRDHATIQRGKKGIAGDRMGNQRAHPIDGGGEDRHRHQGADGKAQPAQIEVANHQQWHIEDKDQQAGGPAKEVVRDDRQTTDPAGGDLGGHEKEGIGRAE